MMASSDLMIQAEFYKMCIDCWNLRSAMTIVSINAFDWGVKSPWNPSLLDITHGADQCENV
jgi:hypothetical protein